MSGKNNKQTVSLKKPHGYHGENEGKNHTDEDRLPVTLSKQDKSEANNMAPEHPETFYHISVCLCDKICQKRSHSSRHIDCYIINKRPNGHQEEISAPKIFCARVYNE